MTKRLWILMLLVMSMGLMACGDDEASTAGQDAADYLPQFEGYYTARESSLTDAMQLFSLTIYPDPQFIAMTTMIDEFGDCADDYGALAIQVYINEATPERAGIVAVINTTRLTSFDVMADCMTPNLPFIDDDGNVIEPCADGWLYDDGEALYFMTYAGTTTALCKDFEDALPRNTDTTTQDG